MPYDTVLKDRLVDLITSRFSQLPGLEEKKMFGGIGYMLNGKMCFGIHKDTLIIRVGVEAAKKIFKEAHVRPMDFTGKVMKGWATVEPAAIEEEDDLERFCQYSIDFVSQLSNKT